MKKIFLLHCFPVPYRNYLFEIMYLEAKKRNIYFEVQFYASSDKSRPAWNFNSDCLLFNHRCWRPIFKIGPVLHLNLDLLLYIYREKPDVIISGGVWAYLNSILITIFSPNRTIAWDETNRHDFGSVRNNFRSIKKKLTSRLKYFASTGRESKLFYLDLLGEKKYKEIFFFNLPNLIDESIFDRNTVNVNSAEKLFSEFNIPRDKKLIYWPARFIADKGIENFLDKIDEDLLYNWHVILIGNGPLESRVLKKIKQKKMCDHFLILNTMPYDKACLFYFISDLFILPSLSDSNPLSVIEAIHSSLPIIISNRVGNCPEVLEEKINGVSLDPYDESSVYDAVSFMLSKSKSDLRKMGEISKRIAIENFSSKKTISKFFTDIENANLL